jgi:hypothetical protein
MQQAEVGKRAPDWLQEELSPRRAVTGLLEDAGCQENVPLMPFPSRAE